MLPMLYVFLIFVVLVTSTLSGVLGMAGGMILMAVLATTLPVAAAMMLHGAVQLTANGSRAWFLREHIQWTVLPWYALGALSVLTAFTALVLVPDAGLVLLLIGLLSLGARFSSRFATLDITKPGTAVACGVIVTAAQLLAGASGPLLDVFYLNSTLSRHAVVANKALTQALGHTIKIVYYGLVVGLTDVLPPVFVAIALAGALLGTRAGTQLLDHINETRFRYWSGMIISGIAVVCVIQGAWLLWNA
mgnify:CR=1 FL=1